MAINFKDYSKTKHTGISIHSDGLRFLLVAKVNGKLHRKTFKSNASHGKADRLKTAYTAREALLKGIEHENNITADIDATVDDYWIKLRKMKSWSNTLQTDYERYYDRNLVQFRNVKLNSVKPAHFTSLNATLNEKGLSRRTILKAYEILKPLFDLAVEDEVIPRSPIKDSHIPVRKQAQEKKIVSDAETKYRKVHEAIMTVFGSNQIIILDDGTEITCKDNPHHRAGFLFGFHGRRVTEALSMHWEDINFDRNTYIIRGLNSKVGIDMEFALPADVRESLMCFRATKGKVFNVDSLDRHYHKIRGVTGIQEFSFHWMRNLCVSALAGMGVNATDLSAMLGHTDATTINKYLTFQRGSSTRRTNSISQKLLS